MYCVYIVQGVKNIILWQYNYGGIVQYCICRAINTLKLCIVTQTNKITHFSIVDIDLNRPDLDVMCVNRYCIWRMGLEKMNPLHVCLWRIDQYGICASENALQYWLVT